MMGRYLDSKDGDPLYLPAKAQQDEAGCGGKEPQCLKIDGEGSGDLVTLLEQEMDALTVAERVRLAKDTFLVAKN